MSALRSSPSLAPADDEILQEQLIHCFNIQNSVIQNLNQYSQHISLQLLDLRKHVDILTHRVIDVQQQHQLQRMCALPPPPPPLLPFPSSLPSSSASKPNEPFIFTPIRSTNSADVQHYNDNDEDEEDEDDDPKITFERIVDLAPVEVKTGEEDEEILFCERAKLYRYDLSTHQYKERGTGPMKILQHRLTGLCRLLMRREQIWKICANHQITRDTTLAVHQGKDTAFVWSAIDFADGVPKEELFCIRFKTRDQAEQFFRQFNEAKEINQKRKTQLNNGNDLPSIERIALDEDEDVMIIAEARPTAEQIHRARRLQLPLTFYLYENKAPCPGCRGCERDAPPRPSPPPLHPRSNESNRSSVATPRTIVRAKRTLPTNRVPPAPTSASATPLPTHPSVVELSQESKKSRHVPSQAEHSSPFSLDDFASDLAKTIVNLAKEELYKRWNDETVDRISLSSSDSHPGFSFSRFDMTVDTSKPFNFNFQGHSSTDEC